jgi:predicted permease
MKFFQHLQSLFRKEQLDQELSDELAFHLEKQIEQNRAAGMTAEEARNAALRSFGGVDQAKEECRDAWGVRVVETLLQDIRYSLRMLVKNPGFSVPAILALALGIGATSTIFSWINSTLLNPVPGVAHTSDLVTVMRGVRSEHPTPPFSYLDYSDLREHTRSLSGLAAYHDDFMSITGTEKLERIYGALTTANYFEVLGVHPLLGRFFLPSEEQPRGGGPVVVISESVWRTRFASSPSIVGRTMQINRYLYTIIGVAPPHFQGCKTALRTDVWIPLGMDSYVWGGRRPENRGIFWLNVFGKLQPGSDRRTAERELDLLMQQIVQGSPNVDRGPSQITLDPLWRSPFGANIYLYKTLPLLLALAAALLLLACANVANLLLVRCVARRREIAIRLSVGAGRWRLMRQLLVESLVLALAGGGIAALITPLSAGTLNGFVPALSLPLRLLPQVDTRVLAVTMGVSIVSAVIFGILPALRTSSLAPAAVLKEEAGSVSGSIRKSRLSSTLVVAQIALSLLLLICAGLFTRSLRIAQHQDPGFDPGHVVVASYDLGAPLGYTGTQMTTFHKQLLAKLQNLPGVESAALADFSPLSFTVHSDYAHPEGYVPQPHESMEISRGIVSPNYFHTLRTPLLEGREFTEQDDDKAQLVAIVNEEFAARYWPGQDALGKRIEIYGDWFNVVGVARNAKYRRLVYAPEPVFFLSLFQVRRGQVIMHVRVAGDAASFAPAVERAVHELNGDLPVFDVAPLRSSMLLGSIFERLAGTFAGAFGLLALFLAAVGLYAVIAYTTRQRTHELAVRMALGAERADIFRLVLGHGLVLTLVGLAAGMVVSLALTRYLRSALYGVTAADLVTYAGVTLLLCLVSLIACFVPALRATRVDPMVALRCE